MPYRRCSPHNHRAYLLVLLLALLSVPTSSQSTCPVQCQSCFDPPSVYTCTQCKSGTSFSQYVWNCQYIVHNDGLCIGLCVLVVILHLFMLALGFGVYQSVYEQVQLASILLWVEIDSRVISLQGTNFGIESNNSFVRTYGVQFIIILFLLSVFLFLVAGISRVAHNPTAVLILRKRAIFPVRVIGLCYNMLLFSPLVAIVVIRNLSQIDIFQLFLSILGLIAAMSMYIGIFFLCNFKAFKLDDPNYYVVCEKMLSVRWWVKNKLFIQMTNNTIIIVAFVLGFSKPSVTIIPMLVSQGLFTLYVFLLIGYTKIRYKLFVTTANLVFLGFLIIINGLISSQVGSHVSDNYKIAYYFFVVALCCLLILASCIQIMAQRHKIGRQLRSFKNRFIVCDKLETEVQLNKYDEHGKREKVVDFHDNQLYGCDLSAIRGKLTASTLQTTIY